MIQSEGVCVCIVGSFSTIQRTQQRLFSFLKTIVVQHTVIHIADYQKGAETVKRILFYFLLYYGDIYIIAIAIAIIIIG